ncbi:hypothetical protein AYI68_g3137 [Smittium mucronatum]|uniref:Uncharacterized protein n=1 Tax=Smittium mucronatum TaxID=133383 RepID=A0A1R0H0R9_9FUNG|nr:hypothetical protein AYI68_g3137 [Smittium mucronatum]
MRLEADVGWENQLESENPLLLSDSEAKTNSMPYNTPFNLSNSSTIDANKNGLFIIGEFPTNLEKLSDFNQNKNSDPSSNNVDSFTTLMDNIFRFTKALISSGLPTNYKQRQVNVSWINISPKISENNSANVTVEKNLLEYQTCILFAKLLFKIFGGVFLRISDLFDPNFKSNLNSLFPNSKTHSILLKDFLSKFTCNSSHLNSQKDSFLSSKSLENSSLKDYFIDFLLKFYIKDPQIFSKLQPLKIITPIDCNNSNEKCTSPILSPKILKMDSFVCSFSDPEANFEKNALFEVLNFRNFVSEYILASTTYCNSHDNGIDLTHSRLNSNDLGSLYPILNILGYVKNYPWSSCTDLDSSKFSSWAIKICTIYSETFSSMSNLIMAATISNANEVFTDTLRSMKNPLNIILFPTALGIYKVVVVKDSTTFFNNITSIDSSMLFEISTYHNGVVRKSHDDYASKIAFSSANIDTNVNSFIPNSKYKKSLKNAASISKHIPTVGHVFIPHSDHIFTKSLFNCLDSRNCSTATKTTFKNESLETGKKNSISKLNLFSELGASNKFYKNNSPNDTLISPGLSFDLEKTKNDLNNIFDIYHYDQDDILSSNTHDIPKDTSILALDIGTYEDSRDFGKAENINQWFERFYISYLDPINVISF